MRINRREFLHAIAAAAFMPLSHLSSVRAATMGEMDKAGQNTVPDANTYDVAVIGAGVFGSWSALCLAQAGQRVLLLDQYGPSNARASSGGESRIIRAGYGSDELYTRWAIRSLTLWKGLFAQSKAHLFDNCGVLWLAAEQDERIRQTAEILAKYHVPAERLDRAQLQHRYPQFNFERVDWGLFEPEAGALMARRAVRAVVAAATSAGVRYLQAAVKTPAATRKLDYLETNEGARFSAGQYVFACGPWLGKVFPGVLADRIFPTRQEVFFFGGQPGDVRFEPGTMPAWIYLADEMYGLPDLEGRGFKISLDRHGEHVDPDTQSRIVSAESARWMREYVALHFPALRDAPIVETRVCQYENTSNGDFLVDRHPEIANVWLVGGGSGHGFKHGPAMGEYVAAQVLGSGATPEPRFSLASKKSVQKRAVY